MMLTQTFRWLSNINSCWIRVNNLLSILFASKRSNKIARHLNMNDYIRIETAWLTGIFQHRFFIAFYTTINKSKLWYKISPPLVGLIYMKHKLLNFKPAKPLPLDKTFIFIIWIFSYVIQEVKLFENNYP